MDHVQQVGLRPSRPVMVFDGECHFCRLWIERWRQMTGEAVDYQPFQEILAQGQVPEIPREQFERSVQLIDVEGRVLVGAEAVYRALDLGCGGAGRWLWRAFHHLPGFAVLSEWCYRRVASHRGLFSLLTRWLWGTQVLRSEYQFTGGLFLRCLGFTYLCAFGSLFLQIDGLLGSDGVLPVGEFLDRAGEQADAEGLGWSRYWAWPTLCWVNSSNTFLDLLCGVGLGASLALMVGLLPLPCTVVLWVCYLSLTTVGQAFLSFQWDNLLLETGLLATVLAPRGVWPRLGAAGRFPTTALWLLRWLLFRLMFASGWVKWLSGDPSWHTLSALGFHYETQPLPTWVGYYAHHLPSWIHTASCGVMFGIELIVPGLLFLPRRARAWAGSAFIGLMVVIILTGNYCFFNLLTLSLCMLCFDDAMVQRWWPRAWRSRQSASPGQAPAASSPIAVPASRRAQAVVRRAWTALIACLVLLVTTVQMLGLFRVSVPWPRPVVVLYQALAPLRSINSYGLFAIMTTTRPEIILEGSLDGQEWKAYEFRYKPGDTRRRPGFVAPHQPRLDWQMWFAALGDYRGNPWLLRLGVRLMQGSPAVLDLLAHNPFPNQPPRYVRAMLYDYRFTSLAEKRRTGAWWRREVRGPYHPPIHLPPPPSP